MCVSKVTIVRAAFRESNHSLSTLDSVKDSYLHLLLLEVSLLDGKASPASSRWCGEQQQVCAGVILPPWWKGGVVEKDPSQGIELQETQAQRVPQRRRRIHVGESELRETNPCVSFVVCLITHFSSYYIVLPLRSTWWCCFCVCRD